MHFAASSNSRTSGRRTREGIPPLSPRPWKRPRLQSKSMTVNTTAQPMATDASSSVPSSPASAVCAQPRSRSESSSSTNSTPSGSRRSSQASVSSGGSRGGGGGFAGRQWRTRIPPSPSPSRSSALDPRYAGRLAPSMSPSMSSASLNSSLSSSGHHRSLVPPPSVERGRRSGGSRENDSALSIFRPPSIDTALENNAAEDCVDDTMAMSGGATTPFRTPDRRLAAGRDLAASVSQSPSVSSSTPASASAAPPFSTPGRRSKFASYFPADSPHSSAVAGGAGFYSPAGSATSMACSSPFHSPSGRIATPNRRSFFSSSSESGSFSSRGDRSKASSASGIGSGTAGNTGYADRFIPSRASSNLSFSVWDGGPRRDGGASSSGDFGDSGGGRGGGGSVFGGPSGEGGGTIGYGNWDASSDDHASAAASSSTDAARPGSGTNDAGGATGFSAGVAAGSATAAQSQPLLNVLLRSELLGENVDPAGAASLVSASSSSSPAPSPRRGGTNVNSSASGGTGGDRRMAPHRQSGGTSTPTSNGVENIGPSGSFSSGGNNFLRYQSPRQSYQRGVFGDVLFSSSTDMASGNSGRGLLGDVSMTDVVNSFHLSPVGSAAGRRLAAETGGTQKRKRRIPKVPFKVLDAPALQDDFYLNLVDWSSLNVLAVGLGSCVYLWSACTSKVTKLCDLSVDANEDVVTSVSWTQRGTHLAVGTNRGEVQIWDTVGCRMIRTMSGHGARVGTLSWSGPTLASGSRDRLVHLRDVRAARPYTARLASHKQEVCGLRWSPDETPSAHLASGGNDNKLLVWDIKNHSRGPVHRFAEHTAAVKAIAWSPHQHGLLASGGGTADRCIRFWNALSGSALSCIDTGSQVCNLAWSRNCNELVSTHGYSLNQIVVWRYPTMSKVATLTGHTYRVLYLAMSPDGSTIVTGAGDETLRFWNVFPAPRSDDKSSGNGLLFPSSPGSVIR